MRGTPVRVTTVLGRSDVECGALYVHHTSATFSYTPSYITAKGSYDLAPALPRTSGQFHFDGIGPFSDAAPDR